MPLEIIPPVHDSNSSFACEFLEGFSSGSSPSGSNCYFDAIFPTGLITITDAHFSDHNHILHKKVRLIGFLLPREIYHETSLPFSLDITRGDSNTNTSAVISTRNILPLNYLNITGNAIASFRVRYFDLSNPILSTATVPAFTSIIISFELTVPLFKNDLLTIHLPLYFDVS